MKTVTDCNNSIWCDKVASVRGIARRAGVSTATVSRVLNNSPAVHPDTRARVLAAAGAAGYATGRRPRGPRIAFAYTQEITIAHPYDSAVLAGVVRAAGEHNADVIILGLGRDKARDERFAQYFQRKAIDGVILRTMAATRGFCERIAEEDFPHVVVSERFDSPKVNFIDGASREEMQRAVGYLLSLGHERVAFGMHNVADRDHLDRLEGYQAAMREHGLKCDEKLIFRQPYTLAGGATLINLLMGMPDRPTAVVLADPLLSLGAVREARVLGVRIPEDLSVVGFDDTDVRFGVYPTLSAVCQNADTLGFEAGRWLLQRLTDPATTPMRRTVPTYFEINDSTAAPAHPAVAARTRSAAATAESEQRKRTSVQVFGRS